MNGALLGRAWRRPLLWAALALLLALVPAGSAEAAAQAVRLLHSAEFRGPLKDLPKWARVLNAEKNDPTFVTSRMVGEKQWADLKTAWSGLPFLGQLKEVNNFFNQWPYRLDIEAYGTPDHWATPREFLKNSGDCEDYSIAKYYALRALGVPADKLRVVVVMNTMRAGGHAVLAVFTGDDWLILDNMSNLILSSSKTGHYRPQYSVNEQYRWAHVPIKKVG